LGATSAAIGARRADAVRESSQSARPENANAPSAPHRRNSGISLVVSQGVRRLNAGGASRGQAAHKQSSERQHSHDHIRYRIAWMPARVRPCIVRINEVSRAEVVSYQPTSYRPQAPEIRYFLSHFSHDYFARVPATLRHDYVTAQWFLDRQLFQEVDDRDRKTQWLPKFLSSTEDDAEVTVSDVVIGNLEQEPYRARVEFTKAFSSRAGQETKRQRWTAAYVFRVNPNVSNEAVPYNPLGIAIACLRSDQAFE
jgi:type IV secretory pathway TrbF-like protein